MAEVQSRTNRPKIPAEIARRILVESGHRCAVCGEGCPLERAHIIPWRESKQNNEEDLICLCANCHQRADTEGWGEKTLREYKLLPWVKRRFNEKVHIPAAARVEITLNIKLNVYFPQRHLLVFALAAFLDISPEAIEIIEIKEGSVKVTLELSTVHAYKLLRAFEESDPQLLQYMLPLQMEHIRRAPPAEVEESKKIAVPLPPMINLVVLNIPVATKDSYIRDLFERYGNVLQMSVEVDPRKKWAKIAFLIMREDAATQAIRELNGFTINGEVIQVWKEEHLPSGVFTQ